MAISDLFSSSFLFNIAIIILLIGAIFAYVSYKMSEQDHKLTSMINLVSILAQDLGFVKNKLRLLGQQQDSNENNNLQYPSNMMGGSETIDLISVSDEEEENDDDDIDEDIDEEIDEDIDEDIDNEDDDVDNDIDNDDKDEDNFSYNSDEDLEIKNTQEQMKLLNLTLTNEDIDNDLQIEVLKSDFQEPELLQNDKIKTVHLDNPVNFEETDFNVSNENGIKTSDDDFTNVLKNITITDLGEGGEDLHTSKSDYKKMSLNKLRDVVVNKGFVTDASKLKKNEILKMLGEE